MSHLVLQSFIFRKSKEILCALDQAKNNDEDDCSDRRGDDRGDEPAFDTNTQKTRKPTTDEGADNSNNDVAEETEAAAPDQFARKPASNGTNNQPRYNSMHIHGRPLILNA